MFKLIRNFLFLFDAENVHVFSLNMLSLLHRFGLLSVFLKKRVDAPVTVMGITFPNPVGLAAGLDKDGRHIDALAQCGFGFIEVGTVTPLAQPGNEKPRLFRLKQDQGIINRMGFNNEGVASLVSHVKSSKRPCIIGINIGKNKDTPLENAVDDYLLCMDQVYDHADYITINISSPNTPGLRDLQHGEGLSRLLTQLKQRQAEYKTQGRGYVPLLVKIAPDLNAEEIHDIAARLIAADIDGLIATNTTNSRPATLHCKDVAQEAGGLSGQPVFEISTEVLRQMANALDKKIPIIAAGGISSAKDAQAKIEAGASLVQIYSGFIFSGPELVHQSAAILRR